MTHVLVIGGGQSAEHEVSLGTAAAVNGALLARGFSTTTVTIERDGRWSRDGAPLGETPADSLAAAVALAAGADVIFPAVHGPLGEDGALAALAALAGKPAVGSGLGAGAIAMDKWATKLVAEAVGIRTAKGTLVRAAEIGQASFAGECVVKPVAAGSSFGVSLVRSAEEWAPALAAAAEQDSRILVEEVVRGREIDVAVLRQADGTLRVGPPLEIHAEGFFDTDTKYNGSARFSIPASVTEQERRTLANAAVRMYEALDCGGVARVDFFLTPEGPVLNEVNTMPGMTAESQVPKMFAAEGTSYEELMEELVRAALAEHAVAA